MCCFCNIDENIQHLFFDCPFAKFIWRIVSIAFNIQTPVSTWLWLNQFDASIKYQALVGVAAICWAIWLSRNDYVFNNAKIHTLVQVIYRRTHWIRSWAAFQKKGKSNLLKQACASLERVTMEIFAHNGWRFSNRLQP